MARVKLEIPNQLLTTIELPVRITDINYGNHLGNDALVGLLHEARVQWLSQHGFTELNAGGVPLILSDLAVVYKSEVYQGERLFISLYKGDITRAGFELFYRIIIKRGGQEIEAALAKTGMVCFDYERKKTVSVPHNLIHLLTSCD